MIQKQALREHVGLVFYVIFVKEELEVKKRRVLLDFPCLFH